MTDERDPKRDQLQESLIESLLVSASRREDHSERVTQAMSQIKSTDAELRNEPGSVHPVDRRHRLVIWPTFAIAIAVLFALMLVFPSSNQPAMAAIQRSLDVAAEQLARKYLLQINFQPRAGESVRIDNELYVQGNDRFAIRHPGILPGSSLWLGQDGDESWVVPAIGPVLKGDTTILRNYLRSREELDTPYLHVATILKRMMSRGYQLETLADEQISVPTGSAFHCRHIRAELGSPDDPGLPHTIELWTSHDSGMAVRLVARWHVADGEIGRESLVLNFIQEEPNLSDAWFSAEGHDKPQRAVIDSSQN